MYTGLELQRQVYDNPTLNVWFSTTVKTSPFVTICLPVFCISVGVISVKTQLPSRGSFCNTQVHITGTQLSYKEWYAANVDRFRGAWAWRFTCWSVGRPPPTSCLALRSEVITALPFLDAATEAVPRHPDGATTATLHGAHILLHSAVWSKHIKPFFPVSVQVSSAMETGNSYETGTDTHGAAMVVHNFLVNKNFNNDSTASSCTSKIVCESTIFHNFWISLFTVNAIQHGEWTSHRTNAAISARNNSNALSTCIQAVRNWHIQWLESSVAEYKPWTHHF